MGISAVYFLNLLPHYKTIEFQKALGYECTV